MNLNAVKKKVYRIPSSHYWEQYWYPCQILILASMQLFMTLATLGMEIGNTVVDLYIANIYSGFWSFPFMILATLATYACVCTKNTQTKAMIALILQIISIVVVLTAIGFLIAFIVTDFQLCLGFQCSKSSSTSYSSSTYNSLKKVFIACELVTSIIYVILGIIFIILYIKCYNKISKIHPIVHTFPVHSALRNSALSSLSRVRRSGSTSTVSHNQSNRNEKSIVSTSTIVHYNGAQKVCPNCKYVSAYIPVENILECPNCGYKSNLVEHAQQW